MTEKDAAASQAEIVRHAWGLHRAGRLAEADRLYRTVLAANPRHPDALHFLGIAQAQQGRIADGLALIERALVLQPNHASAHFNRANMLRDLGRFEDAAAGFTKALSLRPGHAEALAHRGACLLELGRGAAALADFDRALALDPNRPAVHYNRAHALKNLGRPDEALAAYDRVLALNPGHADALNNRALVLFERGRPADAIAGYDRAIAADPAHADARLNRAAALMVLRRGSEALRDYDAVLARTPQHAGALYGRGNALMAAARFEDALASYDRALGLSPGDAAMLNNRGNALAALKRHDEALDSFARAQTANSAAPEAFNNRGHVLAEMRDFAGALESYDRALALDAAYVSALYGRAYALLELKRSDEAVASLEDAVRLAPDAPYAKGLLLHAKRTGCDWQGDAALVADVTADIRARKPAMTPLAFLAVSDSPADNTACARIAIADKYPPAPLVHGSAARAAGRIRLAYLSSDFNDHAVAIQAMGAFEHHDRARFAIAALSYGPSDHSPLRQRAMNAFAPFIDINGKSDAEAARLLRDLNIDIAIDLTGLTGVGRPGILAARPAPLQVNFLGFPGSMGAPYYDYLVADRIVIPDGEEAAYDEKIVRLPGSFMPHDATRAVASAPPTRTHAGLPKQGFVFASFNASFKFTPAMFDIWMRLLARIAYSVLWLPAGPDAARRNLAREAQARGVDPARLIFAPYVAAPEDHLARLALADLFLDTHPYNAHSSACDALWAGLPVLTWTGRSFAARVAASLLHAVGLPELATASPEAYEALAEALARDADRLAGLRAKLAGGRAAAPLFDTARFTRNLEAAYTMMWARHQRGEPPARLAVEEPQGRTP